MFTSVFVSGQIGVDIGDVGCNNILNEDLELSGPNLFGKISLQELWLCLCSLLGLSLVFPLMLSTFCKTI